MANDFSALTNPVIGTVLDVLSEEFTIASLIGKDFANTSAQKGETVQVAVPGTLTVEDVTPAATPPAFTSTSLGKKTFKLDQWKQVRFAITAKEAGEITNMTEMVRQQIAEAVREVLKSITDNLFAGYKKVYGIYSVDPDSAGGIRPFRDDTNCLAEVAGVLNYQLCPKGNRKLVMSYADEIDFKKLDDAKDFNRRGSLDTMLYGELGSMQGFRMFSDAQIPTHTAGTGAGYVVASGASGSTAYEAGTTTIELETGTGTMLEGDVFTIEGVPGTFVVTTALAGGLVTFDPPLPISVDDGAAITLYGDHVVNLAFDPLAFALSMRMPPSIIEGAPTIGVHVPFTDPKTGVPLKLSYIPGFEGAQWVLSALFGSTIIDPRRACRLASS